MHKSRARCFGVSDQRHNAAVGSCPAGEPNWTGTLAPLRGQQVTCGLKGVRRRCPTSSAASAHMRVVESSDARAVCTGVRPDRRLLPARPRRSTDRLGRLGRRGLHDLSRRHLGGQRHPAQHRPRRAPRVAGEHRGDRAGVQSGELHRAGRRDARGASGEVVIHSWKDAIPGRRIPAAVLIQIINTKSRYRPFAVLRPAGQAVLRRLHQRGLERCGPVPRVEPLVGGDVPVRRPLRPGGRPPQPFVADPPALGAVRAGPPAGRGRSCSPG